MTIKELRKQLKPLSNLKGEQRLEAIINNGNIKLKIDHIRTKNQQLSNMKHNIKLNKYTVKQIIQVLHVHNLKEALDEVSNLKQEVINQKNRAQKLQQQVQQMKSQIKSQQTKPSASDSSNLQDFLNKTNQNHQSDQ